MMPLDWMEQGLCTYRDPEIWFKRSSHKAKRICELCPVLWECRVYSLKARLLEGDNAIHGIWGGITMHDRANRANAERLLEEAMTMLARKDDLCKT